MYKATRALIKARQPHTEMMVEVISVARIGGGILRHCHANADQVNDKNPNHKIVSGWMILKYDTFNNHREMLAHYWNVDEDGNYFDITPIEHIDCEYVIDAELGRYANQHHEKIYSYVWSSLILSDGKFKAVDFREDGTIYSDIAELKNELLFKNIN